MSISISDALIMADIALGNLENPRLETLFFLQTLLGKSKSELLCNRSSKMNAKQEVFFLEFIQKRKQHQPLAYILGQESFYGKIFHVNQNVLIPRPETELILEDIQNKKIPTPEKILDLCTGSGILAIHLKLFWPNSFVLGSDISIKALEVAQKNALLHKVNINWLCGDLLKGIDSRFNLVVCNPPYVDPCLPMQKDVFDYEPHLALFSEDQGLSHIKKIISRLPGLLEKNGLFYLECGIHQAKILEEHLKDLCFFTQSSTGSPKESLQTKKPLEGSYILDFQGIKRILCIKKL